ncbi:nucleotide-diphospho-sugar transferase [Mucilaginibacter sp. dw_454]|uniref:nucleotide-diphospho-sugar transferase n=1 Tax=Mucilaginibacter sp. dw_454 TaxID=2720079 RepID=UPI001BD3A965|nr:nucleotide-diphospho-sugar transferase [Mucilaginibacter sp. dw_454]
MEKRDPNYQTQSPVLFIIFSRTDTSLQVLERIKLAKPPRIYITADGPRPTVSGEDVKCAETKAAIMGGIDWDCEVKTLFREENVGPKIAISSAIDWFFENEEEGIILEHDCLPADSFFWYCDTLLEKYRNDTRIWLISGSNLLKGKTWGGASYYYSQLTNGWGFATWKRSWDMYDVNLSQFEESEVKGYLEKIFTDIRVIDQWEKLFKETKSGKINTWDYQAGFAHFFNNCLNIIPNKNLVSNIGYGELAENTHNADHAYAGIPLEELNEIIHPKVMLPEKEADHEVLMIEFMPAFEHQKSLQKHNSARRRFKRWAKSLFKKSN